MECYAYTHRGKQTPSGGQSSSEAGTRYVITLQLHTDVGGLAILKDYQPKYLLCI